MSESVNKISSAGRTKVTLGEIAMNISENEYNPKEKGLDHCVGLEHLDPGFLKIRRWLPITPEMSFTRRFSKGQILFGKRRAYQKKVALADFDGICSSDILVIEAKKEIFVPELLPFIIQDDRFFEYAVGTSSGSLSPRTKWKFLADYEICLPSIDEQRHIATALWAAEDCIVKGERFVTAAERVKNLLMKVLFNKSYNHDKNQTVPYQKNTVKLGDYAYIKGRIGWRGLKQSEYVTDGPFLIAANHIGGSKIHWESCDHISEFRYDESPEIQLQNNDVIISKDGTLGRVALIDLLPSKATINSTMMLIRPDSRLLDSKYLFFYFQGDSFLKFIESKKSGSAVPHIFQEDMKNFAIPLPSLPEQRRIAAILTRCDETIAAARVNVIAAKALKMKMINEMLGAKPII